MSDRECRDARRRLARDGLRSAHLDACAACGEFARALAAVDASLAIDERFAARSTLPPALLARISGAARVARRERTRGGRILEFALRAAAVAAVLVAVALVFPVSLEAAEFQPPAVPTIGIDVSAAVAERIASLREFDAQMPDIDPDLGNDLVAALATGAGILLGAGLLMVRRTAR